MRIKADEFAASVFAFLGGEGAKDCRDWYRYRARNQAVNLWDARLLTSAVAVPISYLVKILTSLAAMLQGIAPLLTVTLSPPMLLCSTVPFGRLLRFGTLTLCGPQPLFMHTTASSPFFERWKA